MAEKKGLDPIQKELLAQVADLHKMPEGAYSLRINGQLEGKNSSEHIQIVKKTDAPGIDIYIQPGTKNESMHIPVILSQSGLKELVYNDFHIGEGSDVTIVTNLLYVSRALEAAELLAKEGISAEVINIHTIKPIDRDIIIKAAKETGRIITIEEHNVIGGLADAVCEVTSSECPVPVRRIGVNDCFGYSGPAHELLSIFVFIAENFEKVIKEELAKK